MEDKFSGRSKSKTVKIAGVCSLIVIIAVILVCALIPNRLSFFKFNSYFRENDYVRYTVLKEYKNLTQSQDRVLEGVKTGAGYIMSRKTESGKEKGYSYSICESDYHRGCYLERNTVLIIDAHPKVYYFEGFCEYMGIRPPTEQKSQ